MIRRGEVYLVAFGVRRGSEQEGTRPALVIQNDAGNASSPTTIVATLTSRARDYPFHVPVPEGVLDLPGRSSVMLEQIQTVSQERLGRHLGQLDAETMYEVDVAIHHSLGLLD
jgi:mRNA interferase MazF